MSSRQTPPAESLGKYETMPPDAARAHSGDREAATDIGALIRAMAEPRVVAATPEDWGLAAMLAGLRTSSNEQAGQHRGSAQDRGPMQNLVGDLQGVLAELLLLRELDDLLPSGAALEHCLFHPGGGGSAGAGDRVDATVRFAERTNVAVNHRSGLPVPGRTAEQPELRLLLETKCHLDLDRDTARKLDLPLKKDFAVNDEAVIDSYRLGALGFAPYIVPLGGRLALRCRLVFMADALRWPLVEYSSGKALARAVSLDRFLEQGADRSMRDVRRELGGSFAAMSMQRMEAIAESATANRADPRLQSLSALSVQETRRLLHELAKEWWGASRALRAAEKA